jgi:hypothetical protein
MKTMIMAIAVGLLGLHSLRSKTVEKLLGRQSSRHLRNPHS